MCSGAAVLSRHCRNVVCAREGADLRVEERRIGLEDFKDGMRTDAGRERGSAGKEVGGGHSHCASPFAEALSSDFSFSITNARSLLCASSDIRRR